jgi:hypothetical protein
VFVGGSLVLWTTYIAPAGSLPWTGAGKPPATAPVPAPASATRPSEPAAGPSALPVPAGQVAFTALEQGIWVKFYDGNGRTLMQKQMDLGETYAVPADASDPQLWTGRPDALSITIGGKPVPKLAEEERTVKDVPVSAEALLARGDAAQGAGSPTG